jgi:hypothetical protein
MGSRVVVEQLAKKFQNFEGTKPRQKKRQKVDQKLPSHGLSLTVSLNNFKQFNAVSPVSRIPQTTSLRGLNCRLARNGLKDKAV